MFTSARASLIAFSAGLAFTLTFSLTSGALALTGAPDSAKVVGAEECAECHKEETETWKQTHHYKTFKVLPRDKNARKIAKTMGFKRIKSGSLCLNCHFSSKGEGKKPKPIAGISCESCHGAAKDWVKRHGEYSGKKKTTETKEEARKRWEDAEAAGMIRPHMIYTLTKNCYSCHVVAQEELVNKGLHSAGSPFELVSWSQGEIRHNTWHNSGKENEGLSDELRRVYYAVGVLVELEESLRALSKATKVDRFAVTMAKRVEIVRLRARRLARATKDKDLIVAARVASEARLSLASAKALGPIADKVAAAAQSFAKKHDGSKLGAIDAYIPGQKKHKGETRPPKGAS